jgi:hypothetical protein
MFSPAEGRPTSPNGIRRSNALLFNQEGAPKANSPADFGLGTSTPQPATAQENDTRPTMLSAPGSFSRRFLNRSEVPFSNSSP